MNAIRRTLIQITVAALTAALASWASADERTARATMERVFAGRPIQSITASPVAGLYEAVVDGCAKDRARAWDDAIRTGVIPANTGNCEDPIAEIAAFAGQHGITGTPTTILSNGRRLVGAVPAAELQRQLGRAAKPH